MFEGLSDKSISRASSTKRGPSIVLLCSHTKGKRFHVRKFLVVPASFQSLILLPPLFRIGPPPVRTWYQKYQVFAVPSKAKSLSFWWTSTDSYRVFGFCPPETLTAEVKPDEVLITSDPYCKEHEISLSHLPPALDLYRKRKKPPRSQVWNKNMHHTRFFVKIK